VAPSHEESIETTTIRVLNVTVKITVKTVRTINKTIVRTRETVVIATATRRLTIANPIKRTILITTTLARLTT
jgi:hypothetical protein